MAETELKLEDIVKLANLHSLNTASRSYEDGLKKGDSASMASAAIAAAKIINPGLAQELLLNATPQAMNYEISHYKSAHEDEHKTAYESAKSGLLEFYSRLIDSARAEIADKVEQDKRNKDRPKEEKESLIADSLQVNLAVMLSELDLNPKYKDDREIVDAHNKYAALRKASPEEVSRLTADAITSICKLSSNAKNLLHDWSRYSDRVGLVYGRMIGSRLLTKDLKLDRDKFEKMFGTKENYAKIAAMYMTTLQSRR